MSANDRSLFTRARDRIAKRLWSGDVSERDGIPMSEVPRPGSSSGWERTRTQKDASERKGQVVRSLDPIEGEPRPFNPYSNRQLAESETIQSIINTILGDIDAVPWSVVPIDDKTSVPDSELQEAEDALKDPNPNPEQFDDLNQMLARDLLETGNCTATLTENTEGRRAEAVPLDAGTFTVEWDDNRILQGFYQYPQKDNQKWGDPVAFDRNEVMWGTYNPTTRRSGFYGYSPVEQVERTINIMGGLVEKEVAELEEGMPSGMITLAGDNWNRQNYDNFKEYWQENVKGQQLSHPVAEGQADFVPFNMTYKELQVLDRQEWYAKLVGSVFGVPTSENGLAVGTGINRATDVSQRQRYKQKTLQSLLEQLEDIWTYQYLHRFFSEDIRLKFDVGKDLMEKETLSKIHKTQLDSGVKTINEIREEKGEESVPWGDKPFHLKTYAGGGSGGSSETSEPSDPSEPSENGQTPEEANQNALDEGLQQEQPGMEDTERTTKEFAGFEDWDECIRTLESEGYDQESAEKICGALEAESETKAVGDESIEVEDPDAVDVIDGADKWRGEGTWLPEATEVPDDEQIQKSFRGNNEWQQYSFQPSAIEDLEEDLSEILDERITGVLNQLRGNQQLLRETREGQVNGHVQKSVSDLMRLIREQIGLDFAEEIASVLAEHKATQVFEAEDAILKELEQAGVNTEEMNLSETRDRVVERIQNRTMEVTKPISERLESGLREVLTQGWQEGWRITKIEEEIQSVKEDWTGYQAERLARDQIGRAAKEGRMGYAKDTASEVGGWEMEWMDSGDHRVRKSHEDMDGEKIPQSEQYIVNYTADGGPPIVREDYPGDSKWGIQCRCDYKLSPATSGTSEVARKE